MTDVLTRTSLRTRVRGALLRPGEEGYEEARRTWNGAVDARPRLIARCAGADDVQEVVRYARDRGLPLAVRGGGHSVVGYGVVDDGVVVDLSAMKAVKVDPARRTVRAAGGLVWGELDLATQRYGLATTGGALSSTGIVGVTLSGGFGHLMRRHGLGVDNLRAADLVTADGERLRVDEAAEPELMWGLRGGGGGFGIATALEYDLHPVGPLVLGGPVVWPLAQAPAALRALDAYAPEAPDGVGAMIVAGSAPPWPVLPVSAYGTPVLCLVLSWTGDPADGERALAPVRSVGTPLADAVRPVPYRALQSLLDGSAAPGNGSTWRSRRLPAVSGSVVDVLVESVRTATSPSSLLNGWAIGGAVSRVPPDATAVVGREPGFELRHIAVWRPDDPEPERHRAWVHRGWAALGPSSCGQYATFLSDEGPEAVRSAYGSAVARLTALKDRYDPDHLFRRNTTVPPSTPPTGDQP